MRNTRKSLLISGGLALGASAMIAAGAVLHESQGASLLSVVLICLGLCIAPFAVVMFLSAIVSGLRKEALEQGKDEIARWKLTAAEWAAFAAQEARWTAAGRGTNLLHTSPYRDGEVIFATKAVIADGNYQDLRPGGLIDLREVAYVQGSPSCLEFSLRAAKGQGASGTGFGFEHFWLRIPVAPAETREAMKVLAHYKARTRRGVAIAMLRPDLTVKICLGLAAFCAVAAIWGFANRETRAYGDLPLIAAVAGVLIGGGALILAAVVGYRVRVDKR